MSKKKGEEFVFSYDPDIGIPKHFFDKNGNFSGNTNVSGDGFIRIQLDKKSRGGKAVTIIWGFDEKTDINTLCSDLKKKAACGGSVKNNKIEIQGDKIDLITKHLTDNSYKVKKVGG